MSLYHLVAFMIVMNPDSSQRLPASPFGGSRRSHASNRVVRPRAGPADGVPPSRHQSSR